MTETLIRPATRDDLAGINEIYNHFVVNTHVTFDLRPATPAEREEWFGHYAASGRHRVFVARQQDRVLGFATSSRWRPRPAYDTSIETSVYCAPGYEGLGLGTQLYTALFDALDGEDVHRAYAGIALPNDASVALHERFGFRRVAYFTEQGRKFDRYWDVAWFEKSL
jgi:phosphinothricin acetyltransferase